LAPRRRKAVNYNEAKLHRKYVTDSETEATAAEAGSDDPDDSNVEDGPQNKVNSYVTDSILSWLAVTTCNVLFTHLDSKHHIRSGTLQPKQAQQHGASGCVAA